MKDKLKEIFQDSEIGHRRRRQLAGLWSVIRPYVLPTYPRVLSWTLVSTGMLSLFPNPLFSAILQLIEKHSKLNLSFQAPSEGISALIILLGVAVHAIDSINTSKKKEVVSKAVIPLQRPRASKNFIGREREIKALMRHINLQESVAICGSGGVGKTYIVAEVLSRICSARKLPQTIKDGIIYYSFYGNGNMQSAYLHIVRSLTDTQVQDYEKVDVSNVLQHKKILLVLDGVEQAENLGELLEQLAIPTIIMTSRRKWDARDFHRIDLECPELNDAEAMLLKVCGREDVSAVIAREICLLLGCLPLAINLAGTYISQRNIPVNSYLTWLRDSPLTALDMGERQRDSIPILMEKNLEELSLPAQNLIRICGRLSFASVPIWLISEAFAISSGQLEKQIGELINLCIADRTENGFRLRHALIHRFAFERSTISGAEVDSLAEVVQGYYHRNSFSDQYIGIAVHVLPIAIGVLSFFPEKFFPFAWQMSSVLFKLGLFSQLEKLIGIAVAEAGLDENALLNWNNKLVALFNESGRHNDAIKISYKNLEINMRNGNKYNESMDFGNIGISLIELGQFQEAISCFDQALQCLTDDAVSKQDRKQWGRATILSNKSVALRGIGDYTSAVRVAKNAYDLYDKSSYSQKATIVTSLGNVSLDRNDFNRALRYFKHSARLNAKDRNLVGIRIALNNMVATYRKAGRLEKAIYLEEQIESEAEKILTKYK